MGTRSKLSRIEKDLSTVARFQEFVNDLLEPWGLKRRADAVKRHRGVWKRPALSDGELARKLEGLIAERTPEKPYGSVQAAVIGVLTEHPEGMRLCDLRRGVDEWFGYPIAKSSVLDCFARRSDGPDAIFERLGHGRYRLRPSGGQ